MLDRWERLEWLKTAPVLYLDVDGTLIRFPSGADVDWWAAHPQGGPANKVKEFLEFIGNNFDVRWLTCWCPSGRLDIDRKNELAGILEVDRRLLWEIENPKSWWATETYGRNKLNGINWDEHKAGRPWVWVEDDLLEDEIAYLKGNHCFDNYIHCDVSQRPNRLVEVMDILRQRFNIPVDKPEEMN